MEPERRRDDKRQISRGRVLQQRLFKAALDELATLGEPINRVLEVDLDGNDVIFALYDLPRTAPRA
jgi:hypothetical protein